MQEAEYKDEAILLVTYENQFELTNEGIEFLSSLKGNKVTIKYNLQLIDINSKYSRSEKIR